MKIVADENIPFLRGRLEGMQPEGAEVIYTGQFGFTPENVKDADALLIRTRTQCNEALLGGSNVKLVATATIGMDQIDREWCSKAGITVRNSPGCNAPGVAQYVWSALLRLGFTPGRDTLGIVGCGNVGSIVREWGQKLGARILVSDPPKEEALREAGGADGIEYAPLERVLSESDAVTLHTPLTRDGKHSTWHLTGETELGMMHDGALLINAARGPVVDFRALKKEVLSGRLRAVIDTWEGEPKVDKELLEAVEYGTYHIAGYSRQGKERATRMVLEAVEDAFGVEVDTTGLCGPYRPLEGLTAAKIAESFDPAVITAELREAPEEFDRLRNDYEYRDEVGI